MSQLKLTIDKNDFTGSNIVANFMDTKCCPAAKAAKKVFPHAEIEAHANYLNVGSERYDMRPKFDFLEMKKLRDRIQKRPNSVLVIELKKV